MATDGFQGCKEGVLVMVHGLLGSKHSLKSVAKVITEKSGMRTLTVDLRDHGSSPWSSGMTYEACSADILSLLDAEGLERPHLLGHSLGGRVVMDFAQRYPDRVDKLIIVDISPFGTIEICKRVSDLCKDMQKVRSLPGHLTLSEARKEAGKQLNIDYDNRNFCLKNLVFLPRKGCYGWRCNVDCILKSFIPANLGAEVAISNNFSCPSIIIRGNIQPWVKISEFPRIQAVFDDLQIATLKGTSHCNYAQKPVQFIDMVVAFLNK